MDVFEAIMQRRSIRSYAEQAVPDDAVDRILRAAMAAPSAGNEQPWHFLVVDDRSLLAKVPEIHQYAKMSSKAQAAILICGEPGLEKFPGFWVQDCSAATQNALLAIQGLGLGGVWCGVHPDEERVNSFRALFGIPGNVVPFSWIPFGFPAEAKKGEDRYKEDRVRRNMW